MTTSASEQTKLSGNGKPEPRLSPFKLILLGLALGVACGLFFGDYCQVLGVIGDAYIGLLQMTVLPFIVISLIANIGRLSLGESKRLALISLLVLALLWAIGATTLVLMPLALPDWEAGSFFSTSLLNPVKEVDFLKLFIPSNPFQSLSSNYVPAVVLFCMFCGFALSKVANNDNLLDLLDTINGMLSRVNHYVIRLGPIGIFAISASATGTLTLEEFGRLQAYLFTYVGAVLLLTLWVLPMLIATFTPFRYRDVLATSGNALITAFVVGSVFVVIPLLIEAIKDLTGRYKRLGIIPSGAHTLAHPEFIIPLAYPFPHLGKIITLLFVPFAAWFYGQGMPLIDYPLFIVMGLLLSFGKVTTTIPFLLDMQQLPADIFQLFLLSGVVAGRFNDLLGTMHLLTFTALTTCALSNLMRIAWLKLLLTGAVTLLIGGTLIVSTQSVLHVTIKDAFTRDNVIGQMHLLEKQVPATILPHAEPNPTSLEPDQTPMQRMLASGKVRIGFHPDNLPFSYYNAHEELVGFDIDMAHRLARDINVEIEFVPVTFATLADQLEADHFDFAMTGIPYTFQGSEKVRFSTSYLSLTLALVARDHESHNLSNLDSLRQMGASLKIGVVTASFFAIGIGEYLPQAQIVELSSKSQFFEDPPQRMDGLVTSAESGFAWTLLYPQYTVINPLQRQVSIPLVYPLAGDNRQLEEFLEHWIELKKQDGTIENLYDYWILGRGTQEKAPRWSIIRDVLHWVD